MSSPDEAQNAGENEDVAIKAWREDMAKMQMGTTMLFTNDFGGAESVFSSGMRNERPAEILKQEGVRDLRGAFALQYALVSVIKGVASLANDQLDECLQRLWFAEQLAAEDSDWLGKSVVRGICTLVGGVVQCLQHSFVSGVFNVCKSWMWIKVLKNEAVEFQGKEREVVRSCALLTLGIFNILLSLLPTSMLKAASLLSGFAGDRDIGLDMLKDCWKEEGMFAPWAALVWAAFNVDTKSFLDEPLSKTDSETCDEIFAWASEKYPTSVFFSGIEADFEAIRKNVDLAIVIIDRAAPFAGELKALEWALNYKRGVYELTKLNFARAAVYFEESLQVYVRVGRRSMVPFMAIYSALCYHVVAHVKNRAELAQDEIDLAEEALLEDDSAEDDDEDLHLDGHHVHQIDEVGTNKDTENLDALSPGVETNAHDEAESEKASNNLDNVGGVDIGDDSDEEDEHDASADIDPIEDMDAATAAAHSEEMLCLVENYRAMKKDNWGRQDEWAFDVYKEYHETLEAETGAGESDAPLPREPWPLLDIVESMIWRMRCTRWMEEANTVEMLALLQQDETEREPDFDDQIRVCACFAQVLLERNQTEPALEWCDRGLALESSLSPQGREAGYALMLHYLRALNMYQRGQLLAARHSLNTVEAADKTNSWIYHYIMFKSNILKKLVAAAWEKVEYATVSVPAGGAHSDVVRITAPGQLVAWEWACLKFDVQFSAMFRPAEDEDGAEGEGAEGVMIFSTIERHSEEDGPHVGFFVAPRCGEVIFEWDNRFSFMRSKSIEYRLSTLAPDEHEFPPSASGSHSMHNHLSLS
ncbi:Tetratricopeptide repeat protein 39C [Hondaea fermentalgiana]|uniref:Tetratricopeptide repeat protein 39C n=1 Tax=Hondaea fermentalgiana TaxID=2315210 RepID=A0A2R5GR23_9STRA|nr:Tetratricopeptide repeat protein 39C [Hondaea fermentalgiana]|eukprot:GBG30334.1 Tetratricopeptide repeat protein 39C [Hondaea fermentalgiana]